MNISKYSIDNLSPLRFSFSIFNRNFDTPWRLKNTFEAALLSSYLIPPVHSQERESVWGISYKTFLDVNQLST